MEKEIFEMIAACKDREMALEVTLNVIKSFLEQIGQDQHKAPASQEELDGLAG